MDCFERSLVRHIVVTEQTDLYDYLTYALFPHIKDEYDQDYRIFTRALNPNDDDETPGIYTISDEQVINDYIDTMQASVTDKLISKYGIKDALELYKDTYDLNGDQMSVDMYPTVPKLVYCILDKLLKELEPTDLLEYYKDWENDKF